MPTYEYECDSCGHCFERFQTMSDAPVKTCPKCGRAVRRLIGRGAGVIFKGNGFHATDYGSGGSAACSMESTGRTCCGRATRCNAPNCAS